MTHDLSLDILLAQLQIQMEGLRSLVVTSPRADGGPLAVAERIAADLRGRNLATRLLLPAGDGAARSDGEGGETRYFTRADAGTPPQARALLDAGDAWAIAAAPGVAEDPSALLLAAAADAVLLVVRSKRTARSALEAARLELESAGANLVGAVLYP